MNAAELRGLLTGVRDGGWSIDDAVERLSRLPYEELTHAHIDHHRVLRRGYGEAVFCAGKTVAQVVEICRRMVHHGHTNILATRADAGVMEALAQAVPVRLFPEARLAVVNPLAVECLGLVCVCTAGTSDVPIAEEAALTAAYSGSRVERIYDVGVAGIHRLLAHEPILREAGCIVAVAGMEGALASVIGGLVSCPVIAVPTSIGYGASFGGVAALLSMLNSCSPGVAVVNIDNGFGAGYLANVINRTAAGVPSAARAAPGGSGAAQERPAGDAPQCADAVETDSR